MMIDIKKISQLKKDFQSRKFTIAKLCEKHGVGRTYVYALAQKNGWKKKEKSINKRGRGRPEKYKPEFCQQATALCMLGYTNEKLAEFFGVERGSIYEWQKTKSEFSNALLAGREKASCKVAVSLFQRACGYTHDEEKVFCSDGEIITHQTKKHYPPDTKAIAIWLKSKEPDLWRDKQEVEATVIAKIGKITEEDALLVDGLLQDITE